MSQAQTEVIAALRIRVESLEKRALRFREERDTAEGHKEDERENALRAETDLAEMKARAEKAEAAAEALAERLVRAGEAFGLAPLDLAAAVAAVIRERDEARAELARVGAEAAALRERLNVTQHELAAVSQTYKDNRTVLASTNAGKGYVAASLGSGGLDE